MLLQLALLTPLVNACSESFHYVVVGGGTAGLVFANRLSANGSFTVAVIEAGDSVFDDPAVKTVETFAPSLFTPVNWNYTSAPQKYAGGGELQYSAGRALGGTTTVNGMTYIRAEKVQIDAWEELGNEGWNWDSMWEYYVQQESFQVPSEDKARNGATYEEEYHGFEGEVPVGWSKYFPTQNITAILRETSEAAGLPFNKDVNGGSMRGFSTWPFTLNATENIRADAARNFYYPVAAERPNLHVFLNTTATRILWDEESLSEPEVIARGVEVYTNTNETKTICATKEVILTAGSLRSPALLEHSGVGNPSILSPLGIKTVVDLPAVGSNLQDQINIAMAYASPTNWTGYLSTVSYLTAQDLFGSDLPLLREQVYANLSAYASTIAADLAPNATTPALQLALLNLHADLIFANNSTVPLAEIIWFAAGPGIAAPFWNLLPFSRGEVHIQSPDPLQHPSIDPKFFQVPVDAYVQAAAAVALRRYYATAPLSAHVAGEQAPGPELVPHDAGWRDAGWEEWFKAGYGTNNHPVGTCGMMAREKGGVVDVRGRVYGVGNVRVGDAGVVPMQVSGHLSATVYAVAGRIADAILGKW